MILDAQNLFSDAQAITATANSDNVIDLTTVRDIGRGETIKLFVNVGETLSDAGSDSTITVDLVSDDNAALSSVTTTRTLVVIPALTAIGTTYYFDLEPKALNDFERYMALKYTVTNGNLTTGKITAGVVRDVESAKKYYSSGFSIT